MSKPKKIAKCYTKAEREVLLHDNRLFRADLQKRIDSAVQRDRLNRGRHSDPEADRYTTRRQPLLWTELENILYPDWALHPENRTPETVTFKLIHKHMKKIITRACHAPEEPGA